MVKLQGHCETPLIMRVLVGLLCFVGAGHAAAAAKASLDDTTIREAVTAWFSHRAAAEAKYGHITVRGRVGHLPADVSADLQAVAARERRLRRRYRLALRRGRQGPQGVRPHRLGARQGREAVLAARRRGRRPGVGSLQADVRQVLGAVPAQVHPVLPSPGVSPSYNNSSRQSDTCTRGITKAQIYDANAAAAEDLRVGPRSRRGTERKERARANYVRDSPCSRLAI